MSGMYDAFEDDDDNVEQGNDSSAMRQLRAADKAKAKRIKELEDQLNSLSKAGRERSVKDVLSSRGLNPKIAALIPQDIEPTEEAISKWVEDFADVFGASAPAQETVPANDLAALRQMDVVMDRTAPSGSAQQQLAAAIQGANSLEELNQIIFGQ